MKKCSCPFPLQATLPLLMDTKYNVNKSYRHRHISNKNHRSSVITGCGQRCEEGI